MREIYGVRLTQIKQWLEEKRLLPLLDGLDEVRPEYQQDCVRAINQWLMNSDLRPRQVALCCRREQYENYPEKLKLDGAVYLQDLTDEQIQTFLAEANQNELRESLVADANLLALIRRPLLLSMAVLAYKELEPTQWRRATSAGDRLNLLLDAYVRHMLTQDTPSRAYRKGKIPSPEQSREWLEILALQLLQESQTDFLIEQIQITWLSTPLQKCLFSVFAVIFWGLIIGVIFWGLIVAVIFWGRLIGLTQSRWIGSSSVLLIGFVIGFVIGSLYGLGCGIDVLKDLPRIESALETIEISLSGLKPQKVLRKLSSWKAILVPTQISVLIHKLDKLTNPKWGFNFEEWRYKVKNLSKPNEEIWNLLRNAIPITIICVLLHTFALVVGYLGGKLFISPSSLYYSLLSSLCIALLVWMTVGGGEVCLIHFMMRLSLCCTRSIPWNYARFLNYATDQLLLQRVGGRYRFMHDLLRQSLAQRRINTDSHLISSQVFFRCGESYRFMEQYDRALQDFDRAIELNPKYVAALAGRGITYRLMERYEEALQDFDRAIKLNPKYVTAIANRGETYRLMERYEEALQDFDRAIKLNPKDEWAIASRGITYGLMERYEEALQDYDRAIELDPKDEWAIASRGETYRLMERYEEALQDFDRAIKLNPKYDLAIASRGYTYQLMERYEEALQDFDSAIKLNPKDEWAIARRGYTYRLMERYEEALQDFNRAIELDPKYQWAIARRGVTYCLMERYEEALQDFDRAIELNPKDEWAIANRGVTYCFMGGYEEALQDFNRAIELDLEEDWHRYLRALVYLVLHQAEPAKADLDTAIQIAQQKHTEKPDNCQNSFNLALYHLVAGNLPTAQGFYQTALQHNASPTNIRFAVRDLEDLLWVFPEQAAAQQVKMTLETRLKLGSSA